MKTNTLICIVLLLVACRHPQGKKQENKEAQPPATITTPRTIAAIPLPEGYERIQFAPGSFAAWLRALPLKKDKTVYLYNGERKRNQSAQYAVIDISTGKKDLQQCADVVMRLRAEYLFAEKKYDSIRFTDFSGKKYEWKGGSNRQHFDQYLETVFGWCGSASLEKQLLSIKDFKAIATGDVLIKGGFPGHAVIVVDMAQNDKGEKLYIIVQGYQPAQDMHVLVNYNEQGISPWYRVDNSDSIIYTPEWQFTKRQLRKW